MSLSNQTYSHVQALTLLLVYDQNGDALRDEIYRRAVNTAEHLGIHRLEAGDGTELMVRTWWYLVSRSWFGSLSNAVYLIRPHQFSTRLPEERAELDLPTSRRRTITQSSALDVYYPIRYALTMIKLSDLVRRLVDYRLSRKPGLDEEIAAQLEEFAARIPPYYHLASLDDFPTKDIDAKAMARRCKIERWLIHQQMFHTYIELHQFESMKPIPDLCIYLANHTIDVQGVGSKDCPVLHSLRLNVTNVTKAASVLVLHLMQNHVTSGIVRSLTLRKVREALQKCDATAAVKEDDFVQVRKLLDLEDKMWQQQFIRDGLLPSLTSVTVTNTPPAKASSELRELQVDWSKFLPSDAGLYPIFESDTVTGEWDRLYEAYLTSSNSR
ncbi:hypothetical protein CBS101457_006947 [Exobasidium rhododendri]|nr:hypothetical protein CBS101457_006947 [Exobasidium rhododendri]